MTETETLRHLLRLARQDILELQAIIAEDQGFRKEANELRRAKDRLQDDALFPTKDQPETWA